MILLKFNLVKIDDQFWCHKTLSFTQIKKKHSRWKTGVKFGWAKSSSKKFYEIEIAKFIIRMDVKNVNKHWRRKYAKMGEASLAEDSNAEK